jgi:hypothetical protein
MNPAEGNDPTAPTSIMAHKHSLAQHNVDHSVALYGMPGRCAMSGLTLAVHRPEPQHARFRVTTVTPAGHTLRDGRRRAA